MSDEVTLIDESGVERRFRMHDAFEVEGVPYYLVEDVKDPERVLLLRETGDGLETVGGEEFERVMGALEQDTVD
jgi:diaminopimelate decarboxylase